MKKLIAFTAVASALWFLPAKAQNTKIQWNKTEHDFGRILESQGPKMVEFRFQNTGKKPMNLVNVVAACGCTLPSWTKDTIYPGKTGTIWARFDPADRAGAFDKIITVQTWNADPEFYVLTLKGIVEPKDMTPAERYAYKQGNLRFEADHVPFGTLFNSTYDTVWVRVYNDGFSTMNVTGFQGPDFMQWQCMTPEIKPKSEAVLRGVLNGKTVNDLGQLFFTVAMVTDDKDQPSKMIYTSADVREYFGPMNKKDSLHAPRISFDKKFHDWGKIKANEVMKTQFVLTNVGKSDLIIRKTKASCGCTASNPEKTLLKKGETTRIWVEYNSAGHTGRVNKNITVWTNDPFEPAVVLGIDGVVEAPPAK